MSAEPWQRYEIPGPVKALVITKPIVVSSLIKRSKNPILVVGHEVDVELDGRSPIDYVIRIAKAADIPVVTTAHIVVKFLNRNFKPAAWMTSMDIGNRLTDPSWSVSGKKAPHDLALILGIPYYMEWLIESGLKSFAYKHLTTVSIDRYYQPHCKWSFPNLSMEDWLKNLDAIAGEVEKK